VLIHFIFKGLASFEAGFISAGISYLRQITECAADLGQIKSSLSQESSLHCIIGPIATLVRLELEMQ
jgi:hypothetical protein